MIGEWGEIRRREEKKTPTGGVVSAQLGKPGQLSPYNSDCCAGKLGKERPLLSRRLENPKCTVGPYRVVPETILLYFY